MIPYFSKKLVTIVNVIRRSVLQGIAIFCCLSKDGKAVNLEVTMAGSTLRWLIKVLAMIAYHLPEVVPLPPGVMLVVRAVSLVVNERMGQVKEYPPRRRRSRLNRPPVRRRDRRK